MAVTPVTLGPALRAWSMSGITHILCDEPVEVVAAKADRLAAQAASARTAQPGPAHAAGQTGRLRTPESTPIQSVCAGGGPGPVEPGRQSAASGAVIPAAPRAPVFASREEAPGDPAAWPAPWRDWAAKASPAPILWTYHELGADLTGKGRSVERSSFLKTLIADLRLPKGSSVFWPSAMPADSGDSSGPGALQANAAVFSAGLARLSPQVVIVFGERALADIGLGGTVRNFGQIMVEGRLLLLVPEIRDVLQNQTQRLSTVSVLRSVLAAVNF